MTAAVTDDDVCRLTDFCVYVRSVYQHFRAFYESSDASEKNAMHRAAPVFFGDLNRILIEYTILQVCKLTDPAKDGRGNLNHTLAFFLENADFSAAPERTNRLSILNGEINGFRDKLKTARNKLVSHLDRDAVMADQALGAVGDSDWSEFWLHLQEFLNILHEHFFGKPFFINGVGNLTDVHGIHKAFKQSGIFEVLVNGDDPVLTRKCADLYLADQPV
jgi:hypothetical protein